MDNLTDKQQLTFNDLNNVIKTVDDFLAEGLSAAEVAEKFVGVLDPSAKPALDSLIAVLQEAKTLVDKL